MIVQDTSPGRGGGEGPIKGVMGRQAHGDGPRAVRTRGRGAHTGRPDAHGTSSDQDGPRP